ncbi:ferritin-like domain-containing protein [Streptococcus equinus]|uniref:ferritin-like domain-containing protein n=1 Tax=Streptococcus equinus TaxID=1335 RepID=UPI000889CC8C|nr:ferritin-like domain-containing protein [Streptococcus equinus]SDI82065.1 bacterioferritin [Streptococcus equinus]SEP87793.1 bacterioferritin [Streptococcus equinus]
MANEKLLEALQTIATALSQQADGHAIQSKIFASQGFTKLADKYAEHANEERDYVGKCIDRILDLGGTVKNGAKEETPVYTDAIEWVKYDLQVSVDGLAYLKGIVELAKDDLTTYDLLKDYYKDEEEDMYWGEQQLDLIEKIGETNWYITML